MLDSRPGNSTSKIKMSDRYDSEAELFYDTCSVQAFLHYFDGSMNDAVKFVFFTGYKAKRLAISSYCVA